MIKESCRIFGLPRWFNGKESICNEGNMVSIPGLGRSSGEGKGNPLQNLCLGDPQGQDPGGLQPIGSQRVRHNSGTKSPSPQKNTYIVI